MRAQDPLGSSVISITQIDAGSAFNVIPDAVVLQGTVRALEDAWMATLHRRVEEARPPCPSAPSRRCLRRPSRDWRLNPGWSLCAVAWSRRVCPPGTLSEPWTGRVCTASLGAESSAPGWPPCISACGDACSAL